jgi:hypothetical protein
VSEVLYELKHALIQDELLKRVLHCHIMDMEEMMRPAGRPRRLPGKTGKDGGTYRRADRSGHET